MIISRIRTKRFPEADTEFIEFIGTLARIGFSASRGVNSHFVHFVLLFFIVLILKHPHANRIRAEESSIVLFRHRWRVSKLCDRISSPLPANAIVSSFRRRYVIFCLHMDLQTAEAPAPRVGTFVASLVQIVLNVCYRSLSSGMISRD